MVSKIEKEKQAERLKGWILGLVNGIDPKMLVEMIKKNQIPTLWEYDLPKYLGFVKGLMVEYKDAIIEHLNIDTVMEYAKEYRPDLAKILVHDRARKWMIRFLNKCKFMFKNIELEPYEIQVKYEKRIMEILAKREAVQAEKVAVILEREQIELEQKQLELERIEQIKANEVERKRAKRQEDRDRIRHEREVRVEEQRQKRLERRDKKKVEIEPQIEVIPEEIVEKLLVEQNAEAQPEKAVVQSDAIDEALFKALGKDASDNKYDFL